MIIKLKLICVNKLFVKIVVKMSLNKLMFDDAEYQAFVDRVNRQDVIKYINDNRGTTSKEISVHFKEPDNFMVFILDLWIKNWNTFFESGRVILKGEKYYCLSPRNPNVRNDNPIINF
jgi:hypothetical protein